MSGHQTEYCSERLQAVKDLYAEMFLLLDQSVQENPLTEKTGGLDPLIDRLMAAIDRQMTDFRREVEDARQSPGLSVAFQADLLEFEEQLGIGLKIMYDRVHRRALEMAEVREIMKGRFHLLQRKRRGAKGYQGRTPATSALIESQA